MGPCIGVGGMGQVHLAMMTGAAGFSRLIAIKRLHAQHSQEPAMRARFEREIRVTARIAHPHVIQVIDVLRHGSELLLAMEYMPGDTLRALVSDAGSEPRPVPLEIVSGILVPALHGLHAAHETRDVDDQPLGLVHRDFSPHNIMVGPAGEVKILDFGIARADGGSHVTRTGAVPGKLGYMAPEQVRDAAVDARADVFAAGVVLWELLAGARLFGGPEVSPVASLHRLLHAEIARPSQHRAGISGELDAVVMRALERDAAARFPSALAFALALEAAAAPATPFAVGRWLRERAAQSLSERAALVAEFQTSAGAQEPPLEITSPFAVDAASREIQLFPPEMSRDWDFSPPPPPKQDRGRDARPRAAVVMAVVAGLGAIAVASWRVSLREPREASAAREGRLESAPAPVASAPTAVLAPETPPNVSAHPAAPPVPLPRPRVGRHPGPLAPANPQVSCDPPTYVAADGIRRFKSECLR